MLSKMVQAAQDETAPGQETAAPSVRKILLMELEGVAVPVRGVVFEALKKSLGAGKFGVAEFIRYGLHAVPEHMANDLTGHLELKATTRDALLAQVNKALAEYFDDSPRLAEGLDALLDAAEKQQACIGFLSWQSDERARLLMERAGLTGERKRLFTFPEITHEFPGADHWLKAAKLSGCDARCCVTLVSSHASCRAALAAGMRCAVVPDAYTSYQDFGGADFVADRIADLRPAGLLAGM